MSAGGEIQQIGSDRVLGPKEERKFLSPLSGKGHFREAVVMKETIPEAILVAVNRIIASN